jgi:CBS domain-containing protein
MQWKDIHHIPVINAKHKIVGIISTSDISNVDKFDDYSAAQVMQKDITTANPDMLIEDAKNLMQDNNIRCLPIVDHNELVGILTKTDLEKLNL